MSLAPNRIYPDFAYNAYRNYIITVRFQLPPPNSILHDMLLQLTLLSTLALSLALPNPPSPPHNLIILDTGVGHRSYPIPQWRTSLRSISTSGEDATTLEQYGPAPSTTNEVDEPIGARDLAYSRFTSSLFLATGDGILRTSINGSNAHVVIGRKDVESVAVADRCGKIYFGTGRDGYIRRANFDGSDVEHVRNVSQGMDEWGYVRSFAAGILVDEEEEWVYWSASRGPDDGSIRRAPMDGSEGYGGDDEDDEVLVKGLNMPRRLRKLQGKLYWCEMGRWSNSPTSLSRVELPARDKKTVTGLLEPEIVVHSNHTTIFFEKDHFGEMQTLGIQSFAFNREGDRLWFVIESSSRTTFAKLVEVRLPSKALKLMNEDTKDLGVPVGIEYVG
jgi:hypothetical protein